MTNETMTQVDSCVMKVSKDAVTRDDLRAMAVGQKIDFALPGKTQFESARSTAWQMKYEHKNFSTKFTGDLEHDKWSIMIERIE